MQTAIIIINLILSVIGLVCIHLKTYIKEKHISNAIKTVVVPGAAVGTVASVLVITPITVANVLTGLLLGVLCGETLYILYLIAKSTWKEEKAVSYYDDGTPAKYFITGDKHRNFSYVKDFCREMNTRRKDVLIILGDTGFNYYEDVRDDKLKKEISELARLIIFLLRCLCRHVRMPQLKENPEKQNLKSFLSRISIDLPKNGLENLKKK